MPVLHDHGQLISQVKINPSVDWRGQHVRAFELNYSKAPFFAAYWPRLKALYDTPWARLGELNIAGVRLLAGLLGITTPIMTSSQMGITTTKTRRLVDICRAAGCDVYVAGSGAADYMDFDLMRQEGITVEQQTYVHPVYPQMWAKTPEEFFPYMSVADLLVNNGGRSLDLLRGIISA